MAAFGPSRRFAATLDVGRSRTEADIGLDFMSTRPLDGGTGLLSLLHSAA
jgi:hypothetical protein